MKLKIEKYSSRTKFESFKYNTRKFCELELTEHVAVLKRNRRSIQTNMSIINNSILFSVSR